MAQAVFNEHPLQDYLQGAGESSGIPGISSELERELEPWGSLSSDESDDGYEWRPLLLVQLVEFIQSMISSLRTPQNALAERFKYTVISSSLLSTSLCATHNHQAPSPQPIPGRLHCRTFSTDIPSSQNTSSNGMHPPQVVVSLSIVLVSILVSSGYTWLALVTLLVTASILGKFLYLPDASKLDMTPVLDSLNELIEANKSWESIVSESMSALEAETQGPASFTPPVRVTLISSLQTVQTQCDNVRQLFSALTSPSNASQLSEMYAPPTPVAPQPPFTLFEPHNRTSFVPSGRPRASSVSSRVAPGKRSTWSGFRTGNASPLTQFRKGANMRSPTRISSEPRSAPVSPPSSTLPFTMLDVFENTDSSGPPDLAVTGQFGVDALELRRKQKSCGMEALRLSQSDYGNSRKSLRLSVGFSQSRFTSTQSPRHQVSATMLHHSVQNALSSKRYACSYLLALRFLEEDDEGYWEDVRSVMSLLSTTFMDSSSRLSEALEALHQQKLRDQSPTPPVNPVSKGDVETTKVRKANDRVSFAPMPSHLSLFASHVAAIDSALEDAKDHLEQCVSALKNESMSGGSTHAQQDPFMPALEGASTSKTQEPQAVLAYERLRRELGVALRECERGRNRLMEIVHPPSLEDDDVDNVPPLAHDNSDDSDRHDLEDESDRSMHTRPTSPVVVSASGEQCPPDDATSHLLLTSSTQHLPPPGIEQVYEAESGMVMLFTKERSKLTREERIKIAKERRGSGLGIGALDAEPNLRMGAVEKWGPGGDVVQELKDVIWKVKERKRKMGESQRDGDVTATISLTQKPATSET